MSNLFDSMRKQILILRKGKKSMPSKEGRSRAVFFMAYLLVFLILPVQYAAAAGLSIKYDGKKVTYTGTQASVTLDGKKISTGATPGLILDNTCMVPFKEVFAKGLDVSCTYNSKKGTLLFEQNDITIRMTLGSKTAYVNNVKKTLDVAPKKIKFINKGVTKVYVPSRFVAESLGYTYVWSSSDKTAQMTSPLKIRFGSDPDWVMYTGVKGKVTYNGKEIDLSDMPSISVDNTTLIRAKKVFADEMGVEYSYNSTDKTVSLRRNDVTIVMTMDSNIAMINDIPHEMGTAARMVKNKSTGKSYVMVPGAFTAKNLGYSYTWNSSTQTSVIARVESDYISLDWEEELNPDLNGNMITNITVSNKGNIDVLSISGVSELSASVKEDGDDTKLYIEVEDVFHEIEPIERTFTDGIFINGILIKPTDTGISITLDKNPNCSYYTSQSGITFQVILCEDSTTGVGDSIYQMKMVLPDDVDFTAIKDEDRYYSKTFILTLEGDYIDYFSDNPILYDPSIVKKVSVSLSTTGNTKIKVVTNKLQGYKLNDCGDYVGINIANPNSIYKNIVVLDAGHGGKDAGASNSTKNEKSLNLEILYTKAKTYFNGKNSEIKAYWTRTDDTFIPLADRASFASKVKADLFISLHMNSASNKSAKGLEVLYGNNNTNKMSGLDSKEMASIFKDQLISDLGMVSRGIINRPNLVVLKTNVVPAVLIELGFISNSSDFSKLSSSSFQKKAAASIYTAAQTCFEKHPTGR